MVRMPDWLRNMMSQDTSLVEDSPDFRQQMQDDQKRNLNKAANQAMTAVQDRTRMMQEQTVAQGMESLAQVTPFTAPQPGTEFDQPPVPRPVPGPEDFAPPPTDDPTQLAEMATPTMPPQQEDMASIVEQLAQASGLTSQQVATMALLGREISRIEEEDKMYAPQPTVMPSGEIPMPPPLMGPPPMPTTEPTMPPPMPSPPPTGPMPSPLTPPPPTI